VRRLDMLRDSMGDDPARWYPSLVGAAWPGGEADWRIEAAE